MNVCVRAPASRDGRSRLLASLPEISFHLIITVPVTNWVDKIRRICVIDVDGTY